MPIGGNAQVTINVGARLQVLQSSVNEIQKVLDKLQPNSAGFKNLQIILNQITKEMDHLQVQTSKPFGSQNQFNQTEKTLDKIEDSLNNAQIALSRISFKDLKLTPDQEQQFKDLRNEIAETKKALDSFKNEQKIELFKNADFKKFADSIDSNLIKKNFSEVAQAVSEESERITNEISKLTSKINQASKEISIGENVKNFTGILDKNKVIKKEFEQFFTQTEQGLKFKPKQQNAFYEYLKEYFSLNDQQLNALKKLSAQKVQEVMTSEGYFEPQLKKAKNAGTRQVSYNTQMTELRAQADAAAAAMGTVETAEEKIAEQSNATEDTVRALEERIRQLELQLTGAAQAAPEMKNGIAGMTGELNSMKTSLEQANVQFLQLQRQRQTFESIKSGIVNFMGFNQVLNITRNAVRAAIDHIKELDTTMNGIAIVTDMTTADLWKQVDAYSTMAQSFGVTIQGAYEVSKIYYQAGYEANDVLTLTNETLKLSKISGLDYATTTDYMMTAMRGFKLEMEDASRVVDVYSNLAANTAVSQQELAEAMTRTASSMESVGATFEETSAMIATMVAVTRESANNIGSAMKSIASRYGELTKDPAALLDAEGEAMSFNKVDTALKSVGITLQTTDHQFRDFTDVIIELAEKWDTLDSAQQRYIATQFAGNRQQSRFLALVSNIDLLQENIANAENSEDVGTLQALKAMDSLESKINQVQVAYQQFYTTIGIENAWKTLLDGTRNVIDTLNSLPKLFNAVPLNAIAAIGSVISVIKSVLFAGLQLVAKELKNFSTQNNQQVEDQNKEGGQRAANSWIDWFLHIWKGRKGELTSEIQGTMTDATGKVLPSTVQNKPDTTDRSAKNSKKLFDTISTDGKRAAQTISTIGSAFSTLSLLINTTSQSGKILSGTLMGLGGVITTLASAATGNVFGIVTGILNIISGISTAYESAEERLARLNKEAEELNNKAKEAKANYNTLQRSVDKLQELEDKRYESAEAAEEYQTAVDELADKFPEMIAGFDEAGNIILDTTEAERILAEAREKSKKATYDAIEGERQVALARVKEAQSNIKDLSKGNTTKEEVQHAIGISISEREENYYDGLEDALLNNKNFQPHRFGVLGFAEYANQLVNNETEALEYFIEEFDKLLPKDSGIAKEALSGKSFSDITEIAKQLYSTYDGTENLSRLYELFSAFGVTLNEAITEDEDTLETITNFINDYDSLDFTKKENIKYFEKYKQALQTLSQAARDKINAEFLDVNELAKQITTLNEASGSAKGLTRGAVSSWLQYEKAQEDAWKFVNENEQAALLLTKGLSQVNGFDTAEGSVEDFINGSEEAQEYLEGYLKAWNGLSDIQKQLFEEIAKDISSFTAFDIVQALNSADSSNQISGFLIQLIAQNYTDGIKELTRVTEDSFNLLDVADNSITSGFNQGIKEIFRTGISTELANFVVGLEKQLAELEEAGLTGTARNLGGAYTLLLRGIQEIKDSATKNTVTDIIRTANLSTKEGIDAAISSLEAGGIDSSLIESIINALNYARSQIISNVALTAQSQLDKILEEAEDDTKLLTKAQSGVEVKDANKLIAMVNSWGSDINLAITDFQTDGKNLVLSEQRYLEIQQTYIEVLKARFANAEETLEQAEKLTGFIAKGEDGNWKAVQQTAMSFSEKQRNFLVAQGISEKAFDQQGNKFVVKDEEALTAINNVLTTVVNTYNEAGLTLDLFTKMLSQSTNWDQGLYGEKYSREDLIAIASDNHLDKSQIESRAIKEKLNEVYSSLISDVLSKGIENVNLADYKGLIAGETLNTEGSYVDFVKEYAQLAGKSVEETNALIIQAIEKDTQKTTGAAQDALRDIDFYSPTSALASRDTLQKLADALGVSIEELYDGYIESLDQYSVDVSKIPLDKITNSADILFDSINSVINSITDYINNGLSGKLKAADVTNLNAQLERYGIQQLSTADFTRTKAGLQLSEQVAFRLYEDLRKIDGIQSQITFNDLAQSLKETNEHYKNFSSIIARINELDSKPSSARSKEYERELRIAKEIAAVRLTTDGGGFNFMNNELPAGMQNPIDYMDSWGKAFKTLNEATTATGDSKNLIDATAFYNIVNELNNLAAIGDDIEFMGYTLDGSLESASELIQKGFNSLKNIDGEGTKVDLSKFGVDFASGADQMNANIENGIHELAASQVAMLDAMIQLLETIVAMEELGDIDVDSDGLLNFDEFVDTTTDIPLFTEKYQKWRDSILQAINPDDIEHYNEDIANALNAVKVNNEFLKDIVSKSAKDFTQTDAQILNALYQAAKSNNWDLDNIAASMKEVLLSSGLEGTIEVGDMKFAIKYGQVFEIDPDNKVLDDNGKTHNTVEEAALENAKGLISGSKEKIENAVKTGYDETGNIVATFKINESVNLEVVQTPSGKTTYKINDKDYSSQSAALFAYYQSLSPKEQNEYSSYQDFILNITGEIIPEITVANENELKGATQDKINELAQALINGTTDDVKAAAATVGIAIDVEGELTAEQRKQIAELAGIESKNVALNITANYANSEAKALGKLLENDTATIEAKVIITDVEDSSGKLSANENGKITVTDLNASGVGNLSLSDCTFSVVDGNAKIISSSGVELATIPLENLIAEGKGDLPSGNCSFKYIPGSEEIQIEFPNGDHLEIPLKNITGTGDLFSNACTISYLENGNAIIKQGNETVATITLHDLKAVGIGELPSGACTFTYNEKDGTVTVDFPNGSFTIPSEAIKAVGTLPGSGCFFQYDGSTITLYDENGNPLAETSVDLTNVLAKGVVSQLGMTLGEGSQATLDEKTGVVSISNVIDAEGHVGTLTITPGEEGVYSGKLTGGSIDVGNVGAVNGTSSNANITATKYTIDFKSNDGTVSKTLKVTGFADITATLAGYGAGLNKENDGSVSLLDQIFASVTASLAEGTVEQLKQDIGEIPVTVSLIPKAGTVNSKYQGTDLESADYLGSTEGGMDIFSLGSFDMPEGKGSTTKVGVDTKGAEKDVEALQNKIQQEQTTPINGNIRQLKADADAGKRYVESLNPEMEISGDASQAINAAQNAVAQISDMLAQVQIDANVNIQQTTTESDSPRAGGGSGGTSSRMLARTKATGNVALAGGTRQTLMGELGPELYVADGHYYIAGQHGAEFVDLPDNAIVFNHLQTERLLKNGSAGRGKAVTNEHKATSLATGNTSGPAMASASAALAALKQIRAMWDAMLHAGISDLGSKAGLGKGGGGGGNKDKGQVVKLDAGYIRDLERWYNLLRQIDRLEQDINYEEKLRAKLQADTVANGKAIYESQRKTYDMLQREIDDRVELAGLKKGYYEQRMAEIQAGPWGQLFYFNEEGVPQMKNLDFLANVFASSEEGGAVHNAREQYAMLQQAGFGQLLQYKEDGSIIEWTDDEGKPREEAYKEAVEAFSAKLDAQTEEVNSLREDYIEEMGTILELQTQQNEILTQIRENTIAVEQEVLKAIEDFREREIDELQNQRDALSNSADKFIDGLTDSLNKEREMYNSQQEDTELLQMRRQLAILQRSGGSASQIRSLQEQIRQREQEAYFEEQENQINAIKEASDLQLERLDAQISLMQETLEYQKAQGLLWDQVHEIMQGTHEEITQFVTGNNSEWWAKSATQTQNDLVELDNKIGQWVAHRDDISTLGETMKNAIANGIAAITSVVSQVSASQQYTVSGTGSYVLPSESSNSGGNSGSSNAGSSKKSSAKKSTAATNATKQQEHKYIVSYIPLGSNSMVTVSYSSLSAAQEAVQRFNKLGFRSVSMVQQYKDGGLIDYTGPAWVDGTKKKPEGILNAEQLDMLRNSVLTRKNPVATLLADYGNTVSNTANANTYNSIDRSGDTIIENAQVVMNVSKLSNDYDAKQAGKTALEEMLRISRKTKPTSVSRR